MRAKGAETKVETRVVILSPGKVLAAGLLSALLAAGGARHSPPLPPGGKPGLAPRRGNIVPEDTSQREHAVAVPPRTRVTVKVNDVVGPEHDVACEAMSDRPVVVERPMCSMYRGSVPAGETLSGYTFNP